MSKQSTQWMFTVDEVAAEFGTTGEIIEQGIRSGLIFVSVVRNRRLISRSEVEHLRRELGRRRPI